MATSLRVVSSHTTKNKKGDFEKEHRLKSGTDVIMIVGLVGWIMEPFRGARPCAYHFGFSCIGCYSAGSKERKFAL